MNMHTNITMQLRLTDLVEEYNTKAAAVPEAISAFKKAVSDLHASATIGGSYGGALFRHSDPTPGEQAVRKSLLTSAWKRVYDGLQIKQFNSAQDRKKWEMSMENPPEFTIENLRATFGDFVINPRHHMLKALAECFCSLDPAYKSHSKVKIGVQGLPKRIILTNVNGYGSWGRERLGDVLGALAVYRGEPRPEYSEVENLIAAAAHDPAEWLRPGDIADIAEWSRPKTWREQEAYTPPPLVGKGVTLKRFANGNGHLFFDAPTLREINLALAEFYGDVLPDAEVDDAKPQPSTSLARDLQYYPTPRAVLEHIERWTDISNLKPGRILEPSCGDGRVMDFLAAKFPDAKLWGVEYHQDRAEAARAKGHSVLTRNFLEVAPTPFDLIVMNPPFYGRHWRKHLDHAREFLAPGGMLVCILPASANYDGHLNDLKGGDRWGEMWRDLPVASFAESGTNIGTGYYVEMRPDFRRGRK